MATTVVCERYAKTVLTGDDEVLTLSHDLGAGTKTLHDYTNTNYQVPVGKKFLIHSVFWSASDTSAGNITISQGAVIDTMGTTIQDLRYPGESNGNFSLFAPVSAGNYITCQGSAGHMSISITGVLTDA